MPACENDLRHLGPTKLPTCLHMVQPQVFFDGLAQDVSIYSSQGSVILLLVVVLLMENRRRLRHEAERNGQPAIGGSPKRLVLGGLVLCPILANA